MELFSGQSDIVTAWRSVNAVCLGCLTHGACVGHWTPDCSTMEANGSRYITVNPNESHLIKGKNVGSGTIFISLVKNQFGIDIIKDCDANHQIAN